MKVVVIGGGIMGLSSAWYLNASGHEVTVLDKSAFEDNCSYGNAGYVCPSHFTPLATPGIVQQGLRWMLNPQSPFYIQPRFSWGLVDWGIKFMRSATPEKVAEAAVPLLDIGLFSKKMYEDWVKMPQFSFAYESKGLLEIFKTVKGGEHARHTVEKAHELGLQDTRLLDKEAMQQLEPQTSINALGAIHFQCDAHLYPNKLMAQLLADLTQKGVKLIKETVTGFDAANGTIQNVLTEKGIYQADAIVLATGSWSREVAAKLKLSLPLVPGRGYSVTLEDSPYTINHPIVLIEGRVALTPMDGNKIRFGGTMEITSTQTPPRMNRVAGILAAVENYFPDFKIPLPPMEKVWYGYRPCSADGLPFIGRTRKWKNLIMATGHAMVGLSLGAGTGKLVSELINETQTSIPLKAFDPDRFA